ncbi:hypothetical protein R6Q59_031661 [Mikania micrantha]
MTDTTSPAVDTGAVSGHRKTVWKKKDCGAADGSDLVINGGAGVVYAVVEDGEPLVEEGGGRLEAEEGGQHVRQEVEGGDEPPEVVEDGGGGGGGGVVISASFFLVVGDWW